MDEDKRIIQIFLALILVGILLIAVIIVMTSENKNENLLKSQPVQQNAQISNSYNTNNYDMGTPSRTVLSTNLPSRKVVYNYDYVVYNRDNRYDYHYDRYHRNSEYWYDSEDEADYSSYGYHDREEDFFGSYVDNFYVYVRNNGYEGRYFEVVFKFCDYSGECDYESIEKYIRAKEKIKFNYRDVQGERYKYSSWSYDIIPD